MLLLALPVLATIAYLIWSPGGIVRDGSHDRGTNGIWMEHGWLGANSWFDRYGKQDQIASFREPAAMSLALKKLVDHGITDLFPHLAPTRADGRIAEWDPGQVERFLDAAQGFRVMPWIGGVLDDHCRPVDTRWRQTFIASVVELLTQHPRLAGIHLNVEPWPSGHAQMLVLLDELRTALPEDKLLSVAAYPPPTRWHPHPEVHWERDYFTEVAKRCDQVAVMMYDTSIPFGKPYTKLMADWTAQVIEWSGDAEVLLGLPAYEDEGVEYHKPNVENLDNALPGIHAGLQRYDKLPQNYQGVALYSRWTMDNDEWRLFRTEFLSNSKD